MSAPITNEQWAERREREFSQRVEAVRAFWPELKRAFLDLADLAPAKGRVSVEASGEDAMLITVSAGVFDLKLAADPLSDTVFYAFTSPTLKKLIPTESAIYHYGQLKLSRGLWGIIDSPGDEVLQVFAEDPQTVQQFPLADRFAQWALDQLLGGYPAITALEEAVAAREDAKQEAAKKEAKHAGGATE